jgi:hypothetical protein
MAERRAFLIRLDPAVLAAVERMAAADFRSVNVEIEVLLREALARRGFSLSAGTPVRRGRPPAGD